MAEHMALTSDQIRVGARLLAIHTAKQDYHALTTDTSVTLDSTGRQGSGLAGGSPAKHCVNKAAPCSMEMRHA